jgi:hypothetical protein
MTIKTMLAKYKGTCSRTGAPIRPGDHIAYDTATRKAWITDEDDGRMTFTTPARAYVSDVFYIGGREYYQNKNGRCIDAPCCGCCT